MQEISDIKEDRTGRLWLISNSRLFSYDPLNGKTKYYPLDTKPGTVSSISVATDGTVWVSTNTGMLEKYIPQSDSFDICGILIKSDNRQSNRIEKIFSLNADTLLIGTLTRGVKLFDVTRKTFKDIVSVNADKSDIFVRDFMKMADSEYWIATETGVDIYNTTNNQIKCLKKEYDDSYSVSDNVILTFCKDREGGLWIGTYFGGLNYYPKQFTTFRKYFPEYSRPSLSGNAVHEICKDGFGNLWVGTEDGGLNKINRRK